MSFQMKSHSIAASNTSTADVPLTEPSAYRYPNSYVDRMHTVDVPSRTSNDVRATMYVPRNVTRTHYESPGSVRHSKPHDTNSARHPLRKALDELARSRNILEISDNHRKDLGRANKELLDQVHAVRGELNAEKQRYAKLQNELTLTNQLKDQAEMRAEHRRSECARVAEELSEERAINANLGAETNALYGRCVSLQEMAVVATARNKELEAQLARLYGTPRERAERAEREKEEMEYRIALEKELKYSAACQKMLEDENKRLRALIYSSDNKLRGGNLYVKQEDEKPQIKKLFIKEEEED